MLSDEFDVGVFQPIIGSWYESLKNPLKFQRQVLLELVEGYGKTRYGQSLCASEVKGVEDFRARFPIVGYRELNPYLVDVQRGDFSAILPEPLFCWVMTRGSTGPAKVIPATRTHLKQILDCGARGFGELCLQKEGL